MTQRLEKGGWIIQSGADYTFEAFPDTWTIGPCGIDAPPGSTPPAGAVGWVHTHPYRLGDRMVSCEKTAVRIGGQTFMATWVYGNEPSDADGMASSTWGLPGYVLDKQKITRFVGDPNSEDKFRVLSQTGRCGY